MAQICHPLRPSMAPRLLRRWGLLWRAGGLHGWYQAPTWRRERTHWIRKLVTRSPKTICHLYYLWRKNLCSPSAGVRISGPQNFFWRASAHYANGGAAAPCIAKRGGTTSGILEQVLFA